MALRMARERKRRHRTYPTEDLCSASEKSKTGLVPPRQPREQKAKSLTSAKWSWSSKTFPSDSRLPGVTNTWTSSLVSIRLAVHPRPASVRSCGASPSAPSSSDDSQSMKLTPRDYRTAITEESSGVCESLLNLKSNIIIWLLTQVVFHTSF